MTQTQRILNQAVSIGQSLCLDLVLGPGLSPRLGLGLNLGLGLGLEDTLDLSLGRELVNGKGADMLPLMVPFDLNYKAKSESRSGSRPWSTSKSKFWCWPRSRTWTWPSSKSRTGRKTESWSGSKFSSI